MKCINTPRCICDFRVVIFLPTWAHLQVRARGLEKGDISSGVVAGGGCTRRCNSTEGGKIQKTVFYQGQNAGKQISFLRVKWGNQSIMTFHIYHELDSVL